MSNEISPTAACADKAGTVGSSTVSTEDPRKTLRRMRLHHALLMMERDAHSQMLKSSTKAADDMEYAISKLEKEIEG